MCARVLFHSFTQVDSINSLLKRPVMARACEETKHFYSDHSHPGNLLARVSVCVCVCFDRLKGEGYTVSLIISAATHW